MKISFGLSASEVRNAIKELEKYKAQLIYKCQKFAERLAEEGVYIARMKIADYNAIYSSELLSSIKDEYVTSTPNGAIYTIYTDCEYAPYVEFGFGLLGSENPHPDTSLINWKYVTNEEHRNGWYYFKDGDWHWSKGQPSKPFMYETARDLEKIVVSIAREVFRN